jgi:hypothetical protein
MTDIEADIKLPGLDADGFLTEGLHELAAQIILLIFSEQSEAELKPEFICLARGFENMSSGQIDFFCEKLNSSVSRHFETQGDKKALSLWQKHYPAFIQSFQKVD